jgi:hypothetical protein
LLRFSITNTATQDLADISAYSFGVSPFNEVYGLTLS